MAVVSLGTTLMAVAHNGGDHDVPQACLDAIDVAEQGFDHTATALTGAHVGIWAAAEQDPDLLEQAADTVERASEDLDQLYPRWVRVRADCRAAAGE